MFVELKSACLKASYSRDTNEMPPPGHNYSKEELLSCTVTSM